MAEDEPTKNSSMKKPPYIKMGENDQYLSHMELFTIYLKYLIFMCGICKAACYECLLLITNDLYPLFKRNIFLQCPSTEAMHFIMIYYTVIDVSP